MARHVLMTALVALPLLVSAGCGVDADTPEDSTASERAEILGGCTIPVPLQWSQNGFQCSGATLPLAPGERRQVLDRRGFGLIVLTCNANGSGTWTPGQRICTDHVIDTP